MNMQVLGGKRKEEFGGNQGQGSMGQASFPLEFQQEMENKKDLQEQDSGQSTVRNSWKVIERDPCCRFTKAQRGCTGTYILALSSFVPLPLATQQS